MRHITRPLVQKSFRSLLWVVQWPVQHNGDCSAIARRGFDSWAEAYEFARRVA